MRVLLVSVSIFCFVCNCYTQKGLSIVNGQLVVIRGAGDTLKQPQASSVKDTLKTTITYNYSTDSINQALNGKQSLLNMALYDTASIANVLSYGADNTKKVTVNAAFNAAFRNGVKRKIRIPAGSYLIDCAELKVNSQTNKKGTEPISNIEIFGDGRGVTKLYVKGYNTGTVSTVNYYPVFNMMVGQSNVIIHDLTIIGNRDSMSNYIAPPGLNYRGHSDTSARQVVNGFYMRYGQNNLIYNVDIDSMPQYGIEVYASQNCNIDRVKITTCGDEAVQYSSIGNLLSSGTLSNSIIKNNNIDQVSCYNSDGYVNIWNCEISGSGRTGVNGNLFAGIYYYNSKNLSIKNCRIFGNSAYGIDTGGPDSTSVNNVTIDGNWIYQNGNGAIVLNGGSAIVNNNWGWGNGKTADGFVDNVSNYNPAFITVYNSTNMTITNNHVYDVPNGVQAWFIKRWGGVGSTFGYGRSIIANNRVMNIADLAHAYNGDDGTNLYGVNLITDNNGNVAK